MMRMYRCVQLLTAFTVALYTMSGVGWETIGNDELNEVVVDTAEDDPT